MEHLAGPSCANVPVLSWLQLEEPITTIYSLALALATIAEPGTYHC